MSLLILIKYFYLEKGRIQWSSAQQDAKRYPAQFYSSVFGTTLFVLEFSWNSQRGS